MIRPLTGFADDVAAFACQGHVSKADYETVLIPDVEERLLRHDKVRIYYEIDPDFNGFDAGAMWDDTRLGFRHFNRWERFAVVTDVDWIQHAVKFFGFLVPGQVRIFPTADVAEAREWIVARQ